jgi:hypothetical protein
MARYARTAPLRRMCLRFHPHPREQEIPIQARAGLEVPIALEDVDR